MSKSRRKKKSPKRVLALPDLEQAKSAVLNALTSKSRQRTYDHAINEFVEWYCSEPRLAWLYVALRADHGQFPQVWPLFFGADDGPSCQQFRSAFHQLAQQYGINFHPTIS